MGITIIKRNIWMCINVYLASVDDEIMGWRWQIETRPLITTISIICNSNNTTYDMNFAL